MKLWFVLDDDNYQIWLKDVTDIQYKDVTKEDEVLMANQSAQEKRIMVQNFAHFRMPVAYWPHVDGFHAAALNA